MENQILHGLPSKSLLKYFFLCSSGVISSALSVVKISDGHRSYLLPQLHMVEHSVHTFLIRSKFSLNVSFRDSTSQLMFSYTVCIVSQLIVELI